MPAAADFAETFLAASDWVFNSDVPRAEFDVVEFDGIELCMGLGDGLGAGALCIAGVLIGAGVLGAECEMLGAGLAAGALGADPVS